MTKQKECKHCHGMFYPRNSMDKACSTPCAIALIGTDPKTMARAQKLAKKEVAERDKARKEKLKSIRELLAEAQTAFNAFIRARDAGLPCICCGKPFEPQKPGGSVDAGHFRSRGAAPQLRFDENNVFAQRKNCNRPGGTTYSAFREGVVGRIGLEAVEALEADDSTPKWDRDALVAIKATYRAKLKDLQKGME